MTGERHFDGHVLVVHHGNQMMLRIIARLESESNRNQMIKKISNFYESVAGGKPSDGLGGRTL